ncbi:MAG: biotin--[acetyl-CoA-carboxylase] ligase [Phycisphaerales bacterium]|nr:MAG: biotin--[acetyl-CoA-carboxylase] ligase [Phycisphaerales bacterium]
MAQGSLRAESIRAGLTCRRLASRIDVVGSVTSGNDVAWQHVDAGADDGLVVFAEHQTAGRGRFGRTWESPHGASVLCSVVILGDPDELDGASLGLMCAIAACDAIRSASGVSAEIRWPNDLVVKRRKVGGVLVESRTTRGGRHAFVVGVGINCLQHAVHFPPAWRDRATSLDMESPDPIDRTEVCRSFLQELDRWLAGPLPYSPDVIREAWCRRAVGLGEPIRLRQAGKDYVGVVVDLDPTAALVVQLDQGARMLFDAESTTVVEP